MNSNEHSINNYLEFLSNWDHLDYNELFKEFNRQSILCLTNVGILGSININEQIEKIIKHKIVLTNDNWYIGRPIMVLENDYSLNLHNGDIGICIIDNGKKVIVFDDGKKLLSDALPKYQLAYALSIHKSQGSEYEHVNIVLPDNMLTTNQTNICSRELIYTAVTRAKRSITLFSSKDMLKKSIKNTTIRNTGLKYLIA